METVLAPTRTLVLGVGNDGLCDEGVGVRAARALAAEGLDEGIRVVDGGTGGFTLLGYLEGVQRLVIIDCIHAGLEPGSLRLMGLDECWRSTAEIDRSAHGMTLLDALEAARGLGILPPEVIIVGVEPARVAPGLELTPRVRAALPAVVDAARFVAREGLGRRRSAKGKKEIDRL